MKYIKLFEDYEDYSFDDGEVVGEYEEPVEEPLVDSEANGDCGTPEEFKDEMLATAHELLMNDELETVTLDGLREYNVILANDNYVLMKNLDEAQVSIVLKVSSDCTSLVAQVKNFSEIDTTGEVVRSAENIGEEESINGIVDVVREIDRLESEVRLG